MSESKDIVGNNADNYTLLSLSMNGVIVRDVSEGKGKFPKDFGTYKIVRPNQMVFCLFDIEETPRTVGLVKSKGMLTGAYNVFDLHDINEQYIYYYYESIDDRKALKPLYRGMRKTIPMPSFMSMPIYLPPIQEQRAIVSFLNTELGKIDTYMDKEQQLIERLKELKQSVIARAVTRGINPNVKMKPSGVNWIGEIPEHWKKCRNKDIMHECKTLVGNQVDRYKLLSLTKQGVIVRDTSEGKGKFPKDFSTYKIIHPNEMVFCLFDVDETPRTVGLADIEGIVTGAYDVFETRKVVEKYIYYYYESLDDRKALKTLYRGLRKTIPMPSFMSMPIYLPPLSEQRAIVDYICSTTSKIDKLISEKTKEMEYMKELRQRIISDAVTGKIDVRS